MKSRTKYQTPTNYNRDEKIIEMYQSGVTLQEVGDQFGFTKEWVRQILLKHGIDKMTGGNFLLSRVRKNLKAINLNKKRDERAMEYYGCSHKEKQMLLKRYGTDTKALYIRQRESSRNRKISWQITFPEWVEAWMSSGHWKKRGRGHGKYVMARHLDAGPYEVENIKIILADENNSEWYENRKQRQMAAQGEK